MANIFSKGIEELAAGAAKAFDEGKEKVKDLIGNGCEEVKKKYDLISAKTELDNLLFEYGKACYYGAAHDISAEILKEEIDDTIKRIESFEKTQTAVNEIVIEKGVCSACGVKNDDDAKFCKGCGKAI